MSAVLDQLRDHLRQPSGQSWSRVIPAVECKDGFKMSVQASSSHYCLPRSDVGPWTHVEVGFPSQVEPMLWEYAETPGAWTESVYPQVPIEMVAAVIEVHGGFRLIVQSK